MNEFLKQGVNTTQVNENLLSIPNQEFVEEVGNGLRAGSKYLSSKYFYDDIGDELFQQIMEMEDYYLTNAEFEIFDLNKQEILEIFTNGLGFFSLIEFGAGDGYKTKVLLEHFLAQNADFKYLPIDISGNALENLTLKLNGELPDLAVEGLQGEYFQVLNSFRRDDSKRKVVLFLGSNIGNFTQKTALYFLGKLAQSLGKNDLLLIGFDLKKDPNIILKAYNDEQGITKAFNLNLLERINRELGGNFNTAHFQHHPVYNPENGQCLSYLISTREQDVYIEALDETFHFDAWESIHTEISQKYGLKDIASLAAKTGFEVAHNLFDPQRLFVDSIWRLKS